MPAGIFITDLKFKDGNSLKLKDNNILVFVGPNNSGKSQSLKEINSLISGQETERHIIDSVAMQKVGQVEEVKAAIEPFHEKGKYALDRYFYDDYKTISAEKIDRIWNNDVNDIAELANFFVALVTTRQRLEDTDPVENFDAITRKGGTHLSHYLFQNYKLELTVSVLFRDAFGTDLVLHRAGSKKIHLYVGDRPNIADGENLWDRSYIDKLENLEPIETQGDGFKSFASVLLRVWTGRHTILLLDEPETFLHPPQARLIGEFIATANDFEKQIFISTHSNDVVQGLINKYTDRIVVVRLQRHQNDTSTKVLDSHRVSELWRDPILRYSNVLSGLFHSQVVVAEADGDCRFYEALSDCQPIKVDTFYTYAGGKDRISILVRALRALDVPVRVVVDFDIFANDWPLKGIVEANEASWPDFEGRVIEIRQIITQKKLWLIGVGFKAAVGNLLKHIDNDSVVPKTVISSLGKIMRQASPWDAVKDAGINAIPKGEATSKLNSLLADLRGVDVFVVPVGEMEGFCRTINGHGPRWVEQVLQKDVCHEPELEEAREFVKKLMVRQNLGQKNFINSINTAKRFDSSLFFYPLKASKSIFESTIFRIVNFVLSIVGASLLFLLLLNFFKIISNP